MTDIDLTRAYLKSHLQCDRHTFRNFESERNHVKDLLLRSVETGESNSALIVGARGSGKTTLIGSVFSELIGNEGFVKNSVLIYLNGLVHLDDKLALKSIATQLQLDNAVDGKIFGSFSENLAFLLACLKSGDKKNSKSCIFVLDEFDLFCGHHNQTLLYNLFDVAQSQQAPICVLGITCRIDVIELLEKRVKSRFSHRQIFLFSGNDGGYEDKLELFRLFLSLPQDGEAPGGGTRDEWDYLKHCEMHFLRNNFDGGTSILKRLPKIWTKAWNKHIRQLCENEKVQKCLQDFYNFDNLECSWKLVAFDIVSRLDQRNPMPTVEMILETFKKHDSDDKVGLLCDLSVLEFCLVIAMKHHCEIYDRDPFNFEMIFRRLQKFTNNTASMQQTCSRSAMLKAFECLRESEIVASINNKTQKEFQMYRLLVTYSQIREALNRYQGMPTEVLQWANNSLV